MNNHILVILLLCYTSLSMAQAPRQGQLLLEDETISGIIDINSFSNAAVVTTPSGQKYTYHASMIKSIQTIDECDFLRTYRCYEYRSNSFFDRREKKIFQVISEGEITLLRRIFEYDVFDASDEYTIDEFYVMDANHKIKRIRNFKRQVLPLMGAHAEKISVFCDRNQMRRLNKGINMYLIISYYNRLKSIEENRLTANN